MSTWAYSYIDNRVSIALVTYDGTGKAVRTVEKPGTRYVFDALTSARTDTVIFVGQAEQYVTVPWSAVGK
jgi:hypothetical protein